MLDSFALRDQLIQRGFRPLSSPDRTKAHGFEHHSLARPIYVKVIGGGAKGPITPATEAPLVIHPDDYRRVARDGVPDGLRLKAVDYTSAGLLQFKAEEGKTPHGCDFWVENAVALDSLLARLGLRQSATEAPGVELAAASIKPSADGPDAVLLAAAAADVDAELAGGPVDATTRERLIEARLGQGRFRSEMLAIWGSRCAVTGCGLADVLVASHAIAWRDAKSPATRLDPYNGLPLAASIDRLFDRGLIGFADDGRMVRQPELLEADLALLGVRSDARLRPDCLHARHRPYLAAHRAKWKL